MRPCRALTSGPADIHNDATLPRNKQLVRVTGPAVQDRKEGMMNKVPRLTTGLVMAALFSIGLVLAQGLQQGDLKPGSDLCCVRGEYRGTRTDTKSPTCTNPKSEDFTLVMNQDPNCGSKIWGTIKSATGPVQNFTGTIGKGMRPCCTIELTVTNPKNGEQTKASGNICWKNKNWVASGTYKNSGGCSGTWTMTKS